MNASDRYKVLMNIVAQYGVEADLYAELAKAEKVINMIDQGKMTPPPLPDVEPEQPDMGQEPTQDESMIGRYDNL